MNNIKVNTRMSICDGVELVLYANGTYILKGHITDSVGEPCAADSLYLLQCYANGCVNKIPVYEILSLRQNYMYSNGVFPHSELMSSFIVNDSDYLGVIYENKDIERRFSIGVNAIKTHTILGLKGMKIIGGIIDSIKSWHILKEKELFNDSTTPTDLIEKKRISDNQNNFFQEISQLIKEDRIGATKILTSNCYKRDRNVPNAQYYAKEILAACSSNDEFWNVVGILLSCNTEIYRSSIIEYFKEHDPYRFAPALETLSKICDLLFAEESKPEKNLDFLYPFSNILSDDIRTQLKASIKKMSQPGQYFLLGNIMNYSSEELVECCLNDKTEASYFCLYELFCRNKQFSKNKIKSYVERIDATTIEGQLARHLINCCFFPDKLGKEEWAIKEGGFSTYLQICNSHKGKKKYKETQDNISSFVGKDMVGHFVAEYSNHYFLMSGNGLRILLPKEMATEIIRKGTCVTVRIVYADKYNNTLFATQQKMIDYPRILRHPLLKRGEEIELSIDAYGNIEPHNCYKKIQIELTSVPEKIDCHKRYKAVVIAQTKDKFHYRVKIKQK